MAFACEIADNFMCSCSNEETDHGEDPAVVSSRRFRGYRPYGLMAGKAARRGCFFFLLSAIVKKNGELATFPKIRKSSFLILEKFYNSEMNLCAKDNKLLCRKGKCILA